MKIRIRTQWLPAIVTLLTTLVVFARPVLAQTVIWNNASSDMTWTEPDALNWSATYNSGDSCAFTNVGAGTITIQTAGVNPGSVLVNTTSNYTFTGGAIGGTGPFTIGGSNIVTFANTNTYTGQTTVTGNGVLNVGTIANQAVSAGSGLFLGDTNASDGIFGILEGNGSFTNALVTSNTPVANQISGAAGGFAARGGPLTVNLGGAGAQVTLNQSVYNFGKNLVFGANNANNQIVWVNPINLNTTSFHIITVNKGVGGDSAEIQGQISDSLTPASTAMELLGGGILILTATNTFPGITLIETGTLQLGNGGASGSLNPNGIVQVNLNGVLAINRTNTITQGVDFSSSSLIGSGIVRLMTNSTLYLTTPNTNTGKMWVDGNSTLNVGNIGNKYASISGGLLLGSTNSASGIYGILEGNGSFTRALSSNSNPGSNQVACAAGGFAAVGGPLTVNIGGAGAQVNLNQGGFVFGNNWIFGDSNSDSQVIVVNPIFFNNGAASGAHRIFTVNSGVGGDSVNLEGPISDSGNPYGLYKDGPGLMILSATNTYQLDTWCAEGTIQITGQLSPAATMTVGDVALSGKFILGGAGGPVNQTVVGLKSNGTGVTNAVVGGNAAMSTLTVNLNNNFSYIGSLGGPGPNENNLALVVSGSGTETLSGTNTYTGNTTVNGGTLEIVNPTIALNSTVSVASGAVLQLDFAVTNAVTNLVLNGVTQAPGIYNSTTAAPYITGAGSLLVSTIATNPTNIMFSFSGNTLNLSWPADHLGWIVQSNSVNLTVPGDWYDIPNTATGTSYSITINPAQPYVFYRLREP